MALVAANPTWANDLATVGTYLYNNRKPIIKMARKAYRGVRSTLKRRRSAKTSLRRTRMKIGEKIGTDSARKTLQSVTDPTLFDSRTLYSLDITNVDQGTQINQRLRGIQNIRGFQLRINYRNAFNVPAILHVAVLNPKKSATVSTDGFFRDYATSRDVNFSTGLSSVQMNHLPISTDQYNILMHKRFRLIAAEPTTATQFDYNYGSNVKEFRRYVRLNRQVRFNDDSTPDAETGRCFLVTWFEQTFGAAGTTAQVGKIEIQQMVTTYHRSPKSA